MNAESEVQKVYKSKLQLKPAVLLLIVSGIGFYSLITAIPVYRAADPASADKAAAMSNIVVGGLTGAFVLLAAIFYLLQTFRGYPKLILSSKGFIYQRSKRSASVAPWSSLKPFRPVALGSSLKPQHIASKVSGPDLNVTAQRSVELNKGQLIIPVSQLTDSATDLADDINRTRAQINHEEFVPQVAQPSPELLRHERADSLKRYWALWFAGIGIPMCLLFEVVQVVANVPMDPFEDSAALVAVAVSAGLASLFTWQKSKS